jgi:hypothetical protein
MDSIGNILIFVASLVIVLNVVPRLNDHPFAQDKSLRGVLRMLGLLGAAAGNLGMMFAVMGHSYEWGYFSYMASVMGVALAWSFTESTGNLWDFVFNHVPIKKERNKKK